MGIKWGRHFKDNDNQSKLLSKKAKILVKPEQRKEINDTTRFVIMISSLSWAI